MPIDKQRVCNILANNRCLVHINIIDVVNDVNALALALVCRFDDPNILLTLRLFKFLVVVVKVAKLFRQNICVWHQVKLRFAIFVLHSDNIVAHAVFARDLKRLRELVDLLVLIQPFVLV